MMDLIARLEAAEAGSRELSGDMASATIGFMEWDGSPITQSLDDALALTECFLGDGWLWEVRKNYPAYPETPKYQANLSDLDCVAGNRGGYGGANTPALALCVAILRAKLAEEPTKG